MIIDVTSTDTTSAAASMKKTAGLNKDDFLQLFVAQLRHQDPLNPQDGTEFISQLAQLTQVEQSYNTNTNLQKLLSQANNGTSLAAVSFIGKEVQAEGSRVSLEAGSPAQVSFSLAGAANQVTVTLQDPSGAVVRTLTGGARATGAGSIAWDGTDNAGNALPSGAYSFSVDAVDASGNRVNASTLIKGTVKGVNMAGDIPVLSLGQVEVPLTDVTLVQGV